MCVNQSLVQITIRFESLSLHLCKKKKIKKSKKILCLPPRRRLTYIAVFNHALGDSKRIMILTMQVELKSFMNSTVTNAYDTWNPHLRKPLSETDTSNSRYQLYNLYVLLLSLSLISSILKVVLHTNRSAALHNIPSYKMPISHSFLWQSHNERRDICLFFLPSICCDNNDTRTPSPSPSPSHRQ